MKCNPDCADDWCKRRRLERQEQLKSLGLDPDSPWNIEQLLELKSKALEENMKDMIESKHEDNPFGIELESSNEDEVQIGDNKDTYLAAGIRTLIPNTKNNCTRSSNEPTVQTTDDSLESLMAKLKNM